MEQNHKWTSPWKLELDEIVDHVENCNRDGLVHAMAEYFHAPSPRYRQEHAAEGKLYLAELVACVLTGARSRGMGPVGVEEFRSAAYAILLKTDDVQVLERELTELFLRIVDEVELQKKDPVSATVSKALQAAERQYMDPSFSLQTIAGGLGVTVGYLGRQICRETGERYSEYLTKVRIRAAMRLLRREHIRTSEIAEAVGFTDPHYFARVFRSHTGMTPLQMRDYIRNQPEEAEM